MIDWSTTTAQDFQLRIEGEGIEESGNHIIFPVRVYHKDGTAAFLKSVPIRSEFYKALKKNSGWKDALIKIFQQRVRDELAQKIREETVAVEEKIHFIDTGKQTV
ncbi:MAG: hypothetical protein NPINA01_18020 [Nitrospinaceae bacterium]|nr:MAG: hypothetical protein NPINA01_18020 [Nitrospinaceae bacterium]